MADATIAITLCSKAQRKKWCILARMPALWYEKRAFNLMLFSVKFCAYFRILIVGTTASPSKILIISIPITVALTPTRAYLFSEVPASWIKTVIVLRLIHDCIRSDTLLKVVKISVSCIALFLCVYSLFNQDELLLLVVQLFVAGLLSVVGVEAILNKQKLSGYLLFGSAAFLLVVNVVKSII